MLPEAIDALAMTPDEWQTGDSMIIDFARKGEVLYAAWPCATLDHVYQAIKLSPSPFSPEAASQRTGAPFLVVVELR